MYMVGAPHSNKAQAQRVLETLIAQRRRLVTDAEVLQEILHRYTAINRREAIGPALKVTLDVADDVLAIEKAECCAPPKSLRAAPCFQRGTRFTLPPWSATGLQRS